eukprot:Gb_27501 [translate_table: standard]
MHREVKEPLKDMVKEDPHEKKKEVHENVTRTCEELMKCYPRPSLMQLQKRRMKLIILLVHVARYKYNSVDVLWNMTLGSSFGNITFHPFLGCFSPKALIWVCLHPLLLSSFFFDWFLPSQALHRFPSLGKVEPMF